MYLSTHTQRGLCAGARTGICTMPFRLLDDRALLDRDDRACECKADPTGRTTSIRITEPNRTTTGRCKQASAAGPRPRYALGVSRA